MWSLQARYDAEFGSANDVTHHIIKSVHVFFFVAIGVSSMSQWDLFEKFDQSAIPDPASVWPAICCFIHHMSLGFTSLQGTRALHCSELTYSMVNSSTRPSSS